MRGLVRTLCVLGLWIRAAQTAHREEVDALENHFTWVPVPVKASKGPNRVPSKPADDRREMDNSYGENYDYDRGEHHQTAASYAAPSGFDTGFGMVQNSVGFSALGFIGFLFFLKLIQDTLTMVNGSIGGRSSKAYFAKRATATFDDSWNGIVGFYVAFVNEDDARCRRQMVCELRARLVQRYKRVGRVVSSVISEILDPILRDADSNRMKWSPSADRNCGFHSGYCSKATGD